MLMTSPPIINEIHITLGDPFYSQYGGCDNLLNSYRDIIRKISSELIVDIVDVDSELREVMLKKGTETIILPDGVHLTVQGNRKLLR